MLGPNYRVRPLVRSDGMMRIFNVETAYGEFEFDGVDFTKMRLRELDAIAALEKMSQSDEFGKAFGQRGPLANSIRRQPHHQARRHRQPLA